MLHKNLASWFLQKNEGVFDNIKEHTLYTVWFFKKIVIWA